MAVRRCIPQLRRAANHHDAIVYTDGDGGGGECSRYDSAETGLFYDGNPDSNLFASDVAEPWREALVAILNQINPTLDAMQVLREEVERGGVMKTDGVRRVLAAYRALTFAIEK